MEKTGKLTLAAMSFVLGLVLPFLIGQIPVVMVSLNRASIVPFYREPLAVAAADRG